MLGRDHVIRIQRFHPAVHAYTSPDVNAFLVQLRPGRMRIMSKQADHARLRSSRVGLISPYGLPGVYSGWESWCIIAADAVRTERLAGLVDARPFFTNVAVILLPPSHCAPHARAHSRDVPRIAACHAP